MYSGMAKSISWGEVMSNDKKIKSLVLAIAEGISQSVKHAVSLLVEISKIPLKIASLSLVFYLPHRHLGKLWVVFILWSGPTPSSSTMNHS